MKKCPLPEWNGKEWFPLNMELLVWVRCSPKWSPVPHDNLMIALPSFSMSLRVVGVSNTDILSMDCCEASSAQQAWWRIPCSSLKNTESLGTWFPEHSWHWWIDDLIACTCNTTACYAIMVWLLCTKAAHACIHIYMTEQICAHIYVHIYMLAFVVGTLSSSCHTQPLADEFMWAAVGRATDLAMPSSLACAEALSPCPQFAVIQKMCWLCFHLTWRTVETWARFLSVCWHVPSPCCNKSWPFIWTAIKLGKSADSLLWHELGCLSHMLAS